MGTCAAKAAVVDSGAALDNIPADGVVDFVIFSGSKTLFVLLELSVSCGAV